MVRYQGPRSFMGSDIRGIEKWVKEAMNVASIHQMAPDQQLLHIFERMIVNTEIGGSGIMGEVRHEYNEEVPSVYVRNIAGHILNSLPGIEKSYGDFKGIFKRLVQENVIHEIAHVIHKENNPNQDEFKMQNIGEAVAYTTQYLVMNGGLMTEKDANNIRQVLGGYDGHEDNYFSRRGHFNIETFNKIWETYQVLENRMHPGEIPKTLLPGLLKCDGWKTVQTFLDDLVKTPYIRSPDLRSPGFRTRRF
ncbi:MAG TPA: hypothetical protein ENN60_03380 [archaeon]|nr:hypothetical protein [archaeon]